MKLQFILITFIVEWFNLFQACLGGVHEFVKLLSIIYNSKVKVNIIWFI